MKISAFIHAKGNSERVFSKNTRKLNGKPLFSYAIKNAFSAKLRNKLRHLRTIKAYLKAQEKNELSQFLMVVYFRAAKMNITDEDLESPFLKVSS